MTWLTTLRMALEKTDNPEKQLSFSYKTNRWLPSNGVKLVEVQRYA